jgi:hypothetical protein
MSGVVQPVYEDRYYRCRQAGTTGALQRLRNQSKLSFDFGFKCYPTLLDGAKGDAEVPKAWLLPKL